MTTFTHEIEIRNSLIKTQEFIGLNELLHIKDSSKINYKKWFCKIDCIYGNITIHPQCGKCDNDFGVVEQYYDYKQTELRELKSKKSFWIGLFRSLCEVVGFVHILKNFYKLDNNHNLNIKFCDVDMKYFNNENPLSKSIGE